MANNLPLRGLGSLGVLTDVNPYDLPPAGFSSCNNVIFTEGKVARAPVLKTLFDQQTQAAAEAEPVSSFSYDSVSTGASVVVANRDNSISDYAGGTYSSATPGSITPSGTDTTPYSHTQISGLSVVNRSTTPPYIRDIAGDSTYFEMSVGDWPSADRATSIRTYKDFLIALNVYESGTQKDAMVKWTDVVPWRANKTSQVIWTASVSNNAGSNILTSIKTPIVDGLALGNVFFIYSRTEVVLMEFTGSAYVFSFKPLFEDDGVINLNCIASTGREHYVFGENDIYMHNGIQKQSIATGRVRKKIYSDISRSNQKKCFVHHDQRTDLIYFCYVSDESDIGYVGGSYPNRAAIYNLNNDTWSFCDLPNVVGSGSVSYQASANVTYTNINLTFDQVVARYMDYLDDAHVISFLSGVRNDSLGLTAGRIYALDLLKDGAIGGSVSSETLKTAFVERIGLDLDESQVPLRSYKQITSFIPQVNTITGIDTVKISLGSTNLPYETIPNYQTVYTFTPNSDYKIDTKASGRLLAYKVEELAGKYFNVSGGDFEVDVLSSR